MKKIYFALIAVAALAWGCKDGGEDANGLPTLRIFTEPALSQIEFSAVATESYEFVVKSSLKHWAVELVEPADWVKVAYTEKGFVVTVEKLDVIDIREATLRIVSDEAISDYPDPVQIKVIQNGTDPVLVVEPVTEVPTPLEFPPLAKTEGTTYTFEVETNCPSWDVTSDQTWCVVTKDWRGEGFTVTAKDYDEIFARPAVVTVTAGTATPVIIDVTQLAATPRFAVTPNTHACVFTAAAKETITWTVDTNLPNGDWSVASDKSWVTATRKINSSGKTVNLTATANAATTTPDPAKVTITANGFPSFEIDVTQKAYEEFKYTVKFGTEAVKNYVIKYAELYRDATNNRDFITLYPYENPYMPFQLTIAMRDDKMGATLNTASPGTAGWGGSTATASANLITLVDGASSAFELDGSSDNRAGSLKVTKTGQVYSIALTITAANGLNGRTITCNWEGTPDVVTYNNELPLTPVANTLLWDAPAAGGYTFPGQGMVYGMGYGTTAAGATTYHNWYYENFDDDGAGSYIHASQLKWVMLFTATQGYAPRNWTYSNSSTSNGNYGYQSASYSSVVYHMRAGGTSTSVVSSTLYTTTTGTPNSLTTFGCNTVTGDFGGTLKVRAANAATNTINGTVTCTEAYLNTLYPAPAYAPSRFAGKSAQQVRAELCRMRDAVIPQRPAKVRE